MGKPVEQNGVSRAIGSSSVGITYGIFPPLECETAAPLDSTDLIEWSFSIALCDDNFVQEGGEDADVCPQPWHRN